MTTTEKADCRCGGHGSGCDCDCCGPSEFVRLRYYFGQRLGVTELADAQSYLVGKQRFHNARAHGCGVLCGLTAARFVFPQGAPASTPTTVLLVRRGMALDGCGRELVVGVDQCIDVGTWFASRRDRDPLKGWASDQRHALWVGLRYRECPSDPAPAPRDPCGCDAGGCEFGRVREGFELALLTDEEHQAGCACSTFPTAEALRDVLAIRTRDGDATRAIAAALVEKAGAACPDCDCGTWLCLARLEVTLEGAGDARRVKDVSEPDNAIPERPVLLSLRALQALVTQLAGSAANEGTLGPAPAAGSLRFTGAAGGAGTLTLGIRLVTEGNPLAATPLAAPSFKPEFVKVMHFDEAADPTWKDVTPQPANVSYVASPDPAIVVTFAAGALAAGRYRLTVAAPDEAPIVDVRMRPLSPARPARPFRLDDSGGTLTLSDTLF